MKKIILFIDNFIIYGLGGIISRIIPFIMIPIVTRLMPNTRYFGICDLSNTLVDFSCAIAIMGMYDALCRLFFEKEDLQYKRKVCSTALVFTCCTSFVIFFMMCFFSDVIAKCFFNDKEYAYIVYISAMSTLVGSTNSIISVPIRMRNKRLVFLLANSIGPIISYSIAIPLLLRGFYTIALPLAGVISCISIEIAFAILNRNWFEIATFDFDLLKQLLMIAVPLLPNALFYWLFNSCDRIMITNLIGIGAAGIYAVGSKLGHASQLIYIAFGGGWQYFAFSTMKEENQVKSNSLVFEYLGAISFVVSAFICAWSFELFKFLFTKDYLSGYVIAPYLFLAPLLLMLFQVAANQFLVIKKTWPNMFVLSVGAVLNIFLNYLLIPIMGIEGAAIATLLGYVATDIVLVLVLLRIKMIIMTYRFIIASLSSIVYFVVWRLFVSTNVFAGNAMAVAFLILMIFLYREELGMVIELIKKNRESSN